MTWRLARTLEVPDEQGDHVLFTHPKTWLRDLDPFARSRLPMTDTEQMRDLALWPGFDLGYVMTMEHAVTSLALFVLYDERERIIEGAFREYGIPADAF